MAPPVPSFTIADIAAAGMVRVPWDVATCKDSGDVCGAQNRGTGY